MQEWAAGAFTQRRRAPEGAGEWSSARADGSAVS